MKHPQLPNFNKVLETDFANFYLNIKGDTLISTFKSSIIINEKLASEFLKSIEPIKKQGAIYSIIDFTSENTKTTASGRAYFKEFVIPSKTKLVAIIARDYTSKIKADEYARFDKPKVSTRVFISLNEGIEWIEEFKA